jgi:hypothetical protein
VVTTGACGGGGATSDGGASDATFAVCAGYDASAYMDGYVATSKAGAYTVTLVSVVAMPQEGGAEVSTPAVGYNTFTVSVRDAGGAAPVGLTMTAEKPFMPKHNHGAATFPVVTDRGDGTFEVSAINFFMPGYWEQTLNLSPAAGAGGTADEVVLSICVPS